MTADSSSTFGSINGRAMGAGGGGIGIITTSANPTGGSHSALLQKQMSFKTMVGANQSKSDEIEVIESENIDGASARYNKVSWDKCGKYC